MEPNNPDKTETDIHLNLSEIFDVKAVQKMMDSFYNITNIGIGIIDMQGNVLVANGWQDVCTRFFRANSESCRNCIESDIVLSQAGPEEKGKFKAYKCKNNLWDISSPIYIGDKHVGNIFLGQFFYDDEIPDRAVFSEIARKYKFDETEFLEALDKIPRWSREKVNHVMQFYSRLSSLISDMTFTNHELAKTLEKLKTEEENLKSSFSLLRMAGKAARFGGWSVDLEKNTATWSDEVMAIHEAESGFLASVQEGINYYAPEWRQKITEVFNLCATQGVPYDEELEIITAKGNRLWIRTLGQALKNENGKIVKVIGSFQDISQRKKDQLKIFEVQEKFRRLYNNMAEGAFYQHSDGSFTDINPAALKMFGITKEQFLQRNSFHPKWKVVDEDLNVIPPEKHPSMVALQTGKTCEMTIGVYNPGEGLYKWLIVNATPEFRNGEEKPWQVFVTMHDVTQRRMYEILNISRLHLLEFAPAHSLSELLEETLNLIEKFTESKIGFFHFLEADQKTLTLQNWSTKTKKFFCKVDGFDLHYPLSEAGVWTDCIKLRKPVIHNDYMSLTNKKGMPEGHAAVIRELVVPVFRGEKIVAILGVGNKPRDYNQLDIQFVSQVADLAWEIADLKRAETALKESKETAENYLNIAAGIILKLDKNGNIELLNDNGRDLLKSKHLSLTGKNWFETCIPADIRDQIKDVFKNLMLGKTENLEQFENRIVTCEGIEKTILWHNEILHDENGNITGALCSGEDITERKEAEQMLLQNELHLRKLNVTKDKLFSVVAHDLKGPFSNIVGFSTLLNDEFDKLQYSNIKEFVKIISKSAVQTMQLLDNLLEWSRLQQRGLMFTPVHINLFELVDDVLEQIKGQAGAKNIKLINLVHNQFNCFADENMLKIIIRNLVSNAVKFTEQGGRVDVNAVKTDNFTEISVTDNGVGIQPENIEKLFKIETEISTRGTASETGTGLGLILCHEFVEKHGGNIKVESTPGKGSKFSFTIPDNPAT